MWHWIRHWADWVMTDVLRLSHTRPHGQAIHTRYEKSGLSLYDLPVPWNADAVVVEVLLRLPVAARRKADFALRLPGSEAVPAESMRAEPDDRYRLVFRLPVPAATTAGELLWKNRLLSRVNVPVLTVEEFLAGLRLTHATVAIRLGTQAAAAHTFVASQCKGLVASCMLRSAVPLAPLADLGLNAVFQNVRTGTEVAVPAVLSSSQRAAREAIVTAVPPKHPRRVGTWTVTWRIGTLTLAAQQISGIPAKRFEQSLRVSDTRFVVAGKGSAVKVTRQPPPLAELTRVGPCFLVASSEPGMAGLCRLQIHAIVSGDAKSALLMEQDVLVTDGPTVFAPGMIEVADLGRVSGFELRHKSRLLGTASLSPVPTAVLNSEGGFKPPPEFSWTNTADDELSERLARLMNGT